MARRLDLSHLSKEECDQILHVLAKDLEVRHTEKERIGSRRTALASEETRTQVLARQSQFNANCCIRCYGAFGLFFATRQRCCSCGYDVCSNCSQYLPRCKKYFCHFCLQQRELAKQTGTWFYQAAGHRFQRTGAARVVRSLYRAACHNKQQDSRSRREKRRATRSRHPCDLKNQTVAWSDRHSLQRNRGDEGDDDTGDDEEQTTNQGTVGPPPPSPSAGGRRLMSVDSGLLLPSSSSSSSRQLRPRTPEPTRRLRSAGKEGDKPRSAPGTSGGSSLLKALPKWDEDRPSRGQVKKVTKDLYKHAFESARKAEERKFKAKFDDLVTDLHRSLNKHSSQGPVDSFANASYGDVLLSFRGQIKDLLIVFSRRLQLAYESFDSRGDTAEDHSQQVKQNVSGFLEDLLGESLDLTSDEAVSDLSSLSDDSSNDRHAFEDQLAQAVVSKIIENHRRDVHHGLRNDRHHLSDSSSLIPEALDDDDDEDEDDAENSSSHRRSRVPKDIDISKDFEDLKHFVEETQSRSKRLEEDLSRGADSQDGAERVTDFRGPESARASSSFDVGSRERDFPALPDFSDLEHIDFESGEVDPDLLQMNLAVIPEETEEELEQEEAEDSQWRDNWIFKGQGPPPSHLPKDRRRQLRTEDDQPQYMMVPTPDLHLAPRVGNRDVDQLSDFLDNDDDDDDRSFYPRTSEELARISKYKRSSSPPSLRPTSLIPSSTDDLDNSLQDLSPRDSVRPGKTEAYDMDLDYEDVGVGTEDFVGPIVEPSQRELKLLDTLVPDDKDDPRFVAPPESVSVLEGEPVKLSCRVAGTQPVDVFWYREQAEVEELEEGEDVELQREGEVHTATLHHLGKQQAGQYMCIALSDIGKAIKYLVVTVKDNKQDLKKPEFLKELKDVEVFEGQSVKFRCKVKGYPPPRIHWYKDGSLLKSNRSCRIEKFGNRDYLLTLDQVTMEDDAEYMVVARNVAGQVKSSAQLIVEPREEGQPIPPPIRAASSLTTLHTDSDSERSTSAVLSDSQQDPSAPDSLTSRSGRKSVKSESGTEDGGVGNVQSGFTAPGPRRLSDSASAASAEEQGQAARSARKLTPNTLSVLQAAQEIIQQEREAPDAPPPGPPPSRTAVTRDSTPASTAEDLRPSSSDQQDLAASVSSGYGSTSMTSSGLDFPDSVTGRSSTCPPHDTPSPQDEFAMYLPPLDEDGSGSYREEVSINLSASSRSKPPKNEQPSGAVSSATSRTVPQPSRRHHSPPPSSSTPPPSSSTPPSSSSSTSLSSTNASSRASSVVSSAQPHSLSQRETPASVKDKADSWQSAEEESKNTVLNFGPKEISAAAYSRDYEVREVRGEERAERKKWSVTLDPYSPSADVVNKRQHVDDGDVKLPLQTDPSEPSSSSSVTPQISPRSSRGSTISTSRESLDSGVSCTPFAPDPRPPPVHMVGETREEEVPESRAEYDADSGVELPSVSRLKAMFGRAGSREDPNSDLGNFKRVHSITARSVSKEQLQKLREGGSHKGGRVQSRSAISLNTSSSTPQGAGAKPSAVRLAPSSRQQQQSSEQAQKDTHAAVPQRRIRTIHTSAHSQPQQPESQSASVFPDHMSGASNLAAAPHSRSRSGTNSPRPKSAILEGTVLSAATPGTPRPRAQSESDNADGAAAVTFKPKIRPGCISARAAFWERRILQGEDADENVEDDFPEMLEEDRS